MVVTNLGQLNPKLMDSPAMGLGLAMETERMVIPPQTPTTKSFNSKHLSTTTFEVEHQEASPIAMDYDPVSKYVQ